MIQNPRLSTVPTCQPYQSDGPQPAVLVRTLRHTVTDARGSFNPRVLAREGPDGIWAAWLEFLPAGVARGVSYTTPQETRQHTRTAIERWASGITSIYAEGALVRAVVRKRR